MILSNALKFNIYRSKRLTTVTRPLGHIAYRYYNAWLETPPPGWQQEMDAFWKATLLDSKTNTLSIGTEITPADTGEIIFKYRFFKLHH